MQTSFSQPPPPRGRESRSVLVLMATTFTAALCFVVLVTILTGALDGPAPVYRVTVVRGPLVSRVDSEVVDLDTILDGGSGAAAGTGMVLTPTGIVLTNNHVIEGASTIQATDIGNGQSYTATVIGYDERRDIAVLQLEGASGLATVTLGNSANVNVNRGVVTIGNAGGVGGTPEARSGIVLAMNRAITVSDEFDGSTEHLTQLIQIHGDLQPGDSGGPMVDGSGDVIGMDTAASAGFTFTGQPIGQGFAIEIDTVKTIAAEIRASQGSQTIHIGPTAFIGVDIASKSSGYPGAHVLNVVPGSAAANAGLGGGDVITSLGGSSVTSPTGLTEALVPYSPGEEVTMQWRDPTGATHSASITLGTGPAE
jgi:S1-C subfamily serine protease